MKQALRNARADYIKAKLEEHGNNSKKVWLKLNKTIKPQTNLKPINLKDSNGDLVSQTETANFINDFFSTIGPKLAEKFHNN